MTPHRYLQHILVGGTAVLVAAARLVPGAEEAGTITAAVSAFVSSPIVGTAPREERTASVSERVATALEALRGGVATTSHERALEDAFRSYFAYRAEHPGAVRKPYLYFVDYGLPATARRGYLFDMNALRIVEGPFTVAHGRGSSTDRYGVPDRFSNVPGSAATSLGLYLTQETYAFRGTSGGRAYRSVGLRLKGLSDGYNSNARMRGVVAHGAPYVTSARAGRSEGCPAMEESRAQRLLPRLADGGMVFLFAPDPRWMGHDPWVLASAD
jgi:hypothetical protein